MKRLFVLVAGMALLVGCAGLGPGADPGMSEPPSSPSSSPAASDDITSQPTASDLVLRLEYEGGFAPVEWSRTNVPAVSIYADGTVIAVGPTTMQCPGAALPNLLTGQLSDQQLDELFNAAREAGLTQGDRDLQSEIINIADAGTTVVTVVVDGESHTTRAYALMETSDEGNAERDAMRDFIANDLDEAIVAATEPHDFEALRVWASPATKESGGAPIDEYDEGGMLTSEADWPLDTPLAQFGKISEFGPYDAPQLRCGVVIGDELDTLLPVIQDEANQLTQWRSGGELYSVQFRPLLPDEEGCPETGE